MVTRGGRDFYVLSQDAKDEDVGRLIARYRQNTGIKLLSRSSSTLEIVKVLRSGAHVAALADISWNGGLVLPFMGRLCTNTTGPAVLGTLASVSIVPAAIYRKGPFRHVVEFFPPLRVPEEKNRRLKMELLTCEVNGALEKIITPHPEQWFWLHNRWKHSQNGAPPL
jgi:KDO2-lipid IV(A) lauroyltransferase